MNINDDDFNSFKKDGFKNSEELAHLRGLLSEPEIKEIISRYDYKRLVNAGGSGIVLEAYDPVAQASRAVKLSRMSAATVDPDPDNPVNVDLEIASLASVSHHNITRFYCGTKTKDNHYCIVTQFVEGALSLDEWVARKLEAKATRTFEHDITITLQELARLLCDYASAFRYMHDHLLLYHMDIKPGNLLVDASDNGYVTDLGFARCKKNYTDDQRLPVGFTFGYAHPFLHKSYKLRVPSTLAKARNVIAGKDLHQRFDLYSFGRTMLALLQLIVKRYGPRVKSNYTFLYLHLLATFLLDGENVETFNQDEDLDLFASEVAMGIKGELLREFKLSSFGEVENRLQRLLGQWSLEHHVPELNRWYPKVINHGHGSVSLTPRLEALLNHPTFRRLRQVFHLGVVSEVYLGATHTRYAHSLGVTQYLCNALSALYNDSENPIFRVVIRDEDLRAIIAAAMLHDLGQSEFGHELEELDKSSFSHAKITRSLLIDPTLKDCHGRTLQNILEGVGHDEWHVKGESIATLLEDASKYRRFGFVTDLLNGPVDVDKLDYLRRDANNCNVPYPHALDVERLLSCLTIVASVKGEGALKLGIKEKGIASSEAVTIARQHMYRAVYLQHTARCLKAMVLTACSQSYSLLQKELEDKIKGSELFFQNIMRELFTAHLLRIKPTLAELTSIQAKKAALRIFETIREAHNQCIADGLEADRSVTFFYGYLDRNGKQLLREVLERRVYKRLAEVSFAAMTADNKDLLRDLFGWHKRSETLSKIENLLRDAVKKTLESRTAICDSLNISSGAGIEPSLSDGTFLLVADLPLRSLGPGGHPPALLRDIQRKRGDFSTDDMALEGLGHIWREGMEKMMNEISVCRIFCEPNFYQIVTATLEQKAIEKIIRQVIPFWPQR